MTKEQIIDILWHLGFQFNGDKAVIDKHTIGTIADTLLAEFEQEKTNLLKEFVYWLIDQPTAYALLIYDRNKQKYLNLIEALEKFLEERK